MTIKEVIEINPEVSFVDVWRGKKLHTDSCEFVEDYDEDTEVVYWEIMDRERYDNTILANSCVSADQIEDFDYGNGLIMLINN